MRKLNILISETEYRKFGLKGNTLSFSEFMALVQNELFIKTLLEDRTHIEVFSESNIKEDETIPDSETMHGGKRLSLSDFSFTKSRKALENYKGSFSDAVIAERRAEL